MFYQAAEHILGTADFWAIYFVSVLACLLPRFVCVVIQKLYYPEDSDIIREEVYHLKSQRHKRTKDAKPDQVEFHDTWWNGRWHHDDERPIIGTQSSRGSRVSRQPESINTARQSSNLPHYTNTFYQSPVETSTPELVAVPYGQRAS